MKEIKHIIFSYFSKKENWISIALFLLVACLPLLVKTVYFDRDVNGIDYKAFPLKRGNYDFFHYWKAIYLVITSFFLIGLLLIRKRIANDVVFRFLFSFCFFVLISSVFSEFKGYTFLGGAESYQGCLVWFSYIIVCFSAFQLQKLKHFKLVIAGLLFSSLVLSIIGLLEYLDTDIHKNVLTFLLAGDKRLGYSIDANINSLSYNVNYYAIFIYLSTIIDLVLLIAASKKKHVIILFILHVFLLINLFGANTLAAILTYFCSLPIILFFIKRQIKQKKNRLVWIGLVNFFVFLIISFHVGADVKGGNLGSRFTVSTENSSLKEIRVKDSILVIDRFDERPLYLSLKSPSSVRFSGSYKLRDDLKVKKNKDTIYLANEGFEKIKFVFKKFKGKNLMILYYNNRFKYNILVDKGTFKTINPYTTAIESIITTDKIDFFNKNSGMLSNRGIIWSLALPKIFQDSKVTGFGADSFRLAFPNKDFLSLIKMYGSKPPYLAAAHSMYLQIALEFGIMALLVFLTAVMWYLYRSIILLISLSFSKWLHYLSLGCFVSVLGFMILGLTNASMISSSLVFWVVLGLGLACNLGIKNIDLDEDNT